MIIKVCGLRDAENIHDVAQLGINWMGFVFCRDSPRFVQQISSRAGIIPDFGSQEAARGRKDSKLALAEEKRIKLCGVFVDDMPQNIVTRVVNYKLDIVQLQGSENAVMIDNLRRTLDPDIRPGIKIMKMLQVSTREDVLKYKDYEDVVDYFLFVSKTDAEGENEMQFDWSLLDAYEGNVPFLLGGGIGSDDVEKIKAFRHPQFMGIDLNNRFETEPAMKDVSKLETFIKQVKEGIQD